MTKFLLGGAALAALIAIPATAQTAQTAQAPSVQRAQVGTQVATMFQRLDNNRDGFVTQAEIQAGEGPRAQRSPEQLMAKRAAAFDRIDTNRDGVLSREEFAAGQALRQQRMGAGGKRMGRMGRMGGKGMQALRGRMFEMADVNRDSRVTLQEATAAAYRRFDMADANRDGQLTREERMQVRQKMRAQRQPG